MTLREFYNKLGTAKPSMPVVARQYREPDEGAMCPETLTIHTFGVDEHVESNGKKVPFVTVADIDKVTTTIECLMDAINPFLQTNGRDEVYIFVLQGAKTKFSAIKDAMISADRLKFAILWDATGIGHS